MAERTPAFLLACLVVVIAALVALGNQLLESSPSTATTPIGAQPNGHLHARRGADGVAVPSSPHRAAPREAERVFAGEQGGALVEADGAVPDNTTVFAVRQAATAAAADGVEFFVESGWRPRRTSNTCSMRPFRGTAP
jgi:hypothetical protein